MASLAGSGVAGCTRHSDELAPVLSEDVAFAFDEAGNRYEMEFLKYEVRRVDATGAVVWTQGSADDPELFNYPTAMAVDAQGTVYVADRGNGEIDTVNANGVLRSTFGRELLTAEDIALDPVDSTLYVSDGMLHRIHAFSLQGVALRQIGSFGIDAAGLNGPRGIAVSAQRELHVVDAGNARIQVYGLNGQFRRSYGGPASESGELLSPRDIVFDAAGGAIVSDPASERLAWFDPGGAFLRHSQLKDRDGRIGSPAYLAIGPGGRLFATVMYREGVSQ
jgi:DNA-binding beta-propeller fold protein YncE